LNNLPELHARELSKTDRYIKIEFICSAVAVWQASRGILSRGRCMQWLHICSLIKLPKLHARELSKTDRYIIMELICSAVVV
jgi:hypothetical protein